MFKNLKSHSSISKGLFGKIFKGKEYLYLDGTLIDQDYKVIEKDCSLTRAAKIISGYINVNGKTWFKRITVEDLDEEAKERLREMDLLN